MGGRVTLTTAPDPVHGLGVPISRRQRWRFRELLAWRIQRAAYEEIVSVPNVTELVDRGGWQQERRG